MGPDARVALSIEDQIARLQLVRGEEGNAIDPAMVDALAAAVDEIEQAASGEVRAILIDADGPAFTVGGDLKFFAKHRDQLAEQLAGMIPPFHSALFRLASQPAPVVCAVQGPIAGGGLGLAWCSDIVLAAPEAKFACGFHKLSLSGDGGSSWFLLRLVGLRRAQEMYLGGRVLDADEALDWGLITEIVEANRLQARSLELAERFAAGPPLAFAHMRALLRSSSETGLEQQLARECEALLECGSSADAVEGVSAFVERRPPHFKGS